MSAAAASHAPSGVRAEGDAPGCPRAIGTCNRLLLGLFDDHIPF